MTAAELDREQAAGRITILWRPQPKQAKALACPAFELLYGGAAGGGKSDFLLADFMGGANRWGKNWRGILFRRTYPELEELVQRARELYLPLGAGYHEQKKTFTFPNGSYIRFRSLERESDVTSYQGHQYTWIGFDELGNYPTDFAWRYMISRARSAAGAPCYMRGTANPGGSGHAWIKNRFIDGFEPGKIRRVALESGETVTRCFIPSTIEDNRILMQHDPNYITRMKLLPARLYRALRHGDWDVFAGQVFDEFRRERHVVKPFALEPGAWKKFYSLDWGFTKPFSLGKWAVDLDGRMIRYGEWYGCSDAEMNTGIKTGSGDVAAKAWAMAVQEGVTECVADPACWNKVDRDPSVAERFEEAGFRMIRGNHDRINGLAMFHQRLMTDGVDGRPMMMVFDHCVHFIRTIPSLVPDPSKPEDVDTSLEDHVYDESRYAVMSKFSHNPAAALARQNGQWNFSGRGKSWNPLDRF
jgi:hypothetical protein